MQNQPHNNTLIFNPQPFIEKIATGTGDSLSKQYKPVCEFFFQTNLQYLDQYPIESLLRFRSDFIDWLLISIWQQICSDDFQAFSVIALGGFGRRQLHPFSDIDILVLLKKKPSFETSEQVGAFVTALWDLKLEIGHSVRTLPEAMSDAQSDLSFMTSMMESRLLLGSDDLFQALQTKLNKKKIWPPDIFFHAKQQERAERHQRYDDTPYKLEPNIKKSPGGLREIQVINWVMQRTFGTTDFPVLVNKEILQIQELNSLQQGLNFLNKIRFVLHYVTNKREDRLLFDNQYAVAKKMGYQGDSQKAIIESFMKDYYQTALKNRALTDITLAFFAELHRKKIYKEKIIDGDFSMQGSSIKIRFPEKIPETPSLLIRIFLCMAENKTIKTIHSDSIRAIRRSLKLIDENFRATSAHNQLFLALLRHPNGVPQLRLMKRLGVLSSFIPELALVTGQMQFDLFHIYTVDEHTLFVVQNLHELSKEEDSALSPDNYPMCHDIFHGIQEPECLYIAALFHDIAKGRGGDHSELGAEDVEKFCRRLTLGAYQTRLIVWLVKNHLLMSITAQKKDIADPAVISEFASAVRDQMHLDSIYLLTVADISATNKVLWNQWKASLLKNLYESTNHLIIRGLENAPHKKQLIRETKLDAIALLESKGFTMKEVLSVWQLLDTDYFLKQSAEDIAWQSRAIAEHGESREPLIEMREHPSGGATEVLVYCPDEAFLFGRMTEAFLRLGLTVVSASVMGAKNHFALDTYIVLDANSGLAVTEITRIERIKQALTEQLKHSDRCIVDVNRKIPLKIRQFPIKTEVMFSQDEINQQTIIEVTSLDRPGLLAHIGNVFYQQEVVLESAKIMTIGERVEDSFYVKDLLGKPITDSEKQKAIATGIKQLDDS